MQVPSMQPALLLKAPQEMWAAHSAQIQAGSDPGGWDDRNATRRMQRSVNNGRSALKERKLKII